MKPFLTYVAVLIAACGFLAFTPAAGLAAPDIDRAAFAAVAEPADADEPRVAPDVASAASAHARPRPLAPHPQRAFIAAAGRPLDPPHPPPD